MAKKHKHKKQKTKHVYRNATPASAPRAPRAPRAKAAGEDTSSKRLLYTAAGAGGTALVGSFLARQGWAPKTVAGALAAVGTGLAWKGDGATIQSVGAGAMSAAGSQLALMLIDDRDRKPSAPTTAKKPSNADDLPPGALENALERARTRLALATSELPDDDMG
jgi:hypothetical protein